MACRSAAETLASVIVVAAVTICFCPSGQYRQLLCLGLVVMAALRNSAGHYIFVLWFILLSSSFLFLAYSQRSEIGRLPYFHTMMWP